MNEIITVFTINCFESEDPSQLGESCSLLPWDSRRPDRRGQDDGGREYILREGYSVGTDDDFNPAVLGKNGPCDLMLHNGLPMLVDREKRRAFLLEPVKKIASFREVLGITREELANRLEVTQKELFEWENLEKKPDANTLGRIAAALGCSVSDLT